LFDYEEQEEEEEEEERNFQELSKDTKGKAFLLPVVLDSTSNFFSIWVNDLHDEVLKVIDCFAFDLLGNPRHDAVWGSRKSHEISKKCHERLRAKRFHRLLQLLSVIVLSRRHLSCRHANHHRHNRLFHRM